MAERVQVLQLGADTGTKRRHHLDCNSSAILSSNLHHELYLISLEIDGLIVECP